MDELHAVLRRRAVALARRRAAPAAPSAGRWVLLSRGTTAFALEASLVLEVVRLESLTPLPGSPVWLAGIVPYRGRILAVYDGDGDGDGRGAGDGGAAPDPDRRGDRRPGIAAVLADGTREMGVLADAVLGLGSPPGDGIRAAPPSAGLGRWAQGLGMDGTLYLDGLRMLADPSLTLEDPL